MFSIENSVFDRTLTHLDLPVLHLTLTLPVVSGGKVRAARRINALYAHIAGAIETHARRHLLPQAARSFDEHLARNRRFEPWRVKMSFTCEQPDGGLVVTRRLYARFDDDEKELELTDNWEAK